MAHLMVFTIDRLSNIAKKGEVLPNYYNPENMFSQVTLVTCNWRIDTVDVAAIQPMVGAADLDIVQYTLPSPITTCGWRFVDRWIGKGVSQLSGMKPDLIWSLNNFQHGQLAAALSTVAEIPLAVSLHGRWDVDERHTLSRWMYSVLRRHAEEQCLQRADVTIPVYADIIPYARKRGARKIELVYNAIDADYLVAKTDYGLKAPPHLVTVNRQVPQKDPSNIIRAISQFKIDCRLDVIGDGPIHGRLEELVRSLGLQDRVHFYPAIANRELCGKIPEYDLLLSTCHYHGISKTLLEAGYAGVPIIVNQRRPEPVSELNDDWTCVVEDTVDAYGQAMQRLLGDAGLRRELGEKARDTVQTKYGPQNGEKKRAAIFADLLGRDRRGVGEMVVEGAA